MYNANEISGGEDFRKIRNSFRVLRTRTHQQMR